MITSAILSKDGGRDVNEDSAGEANVKDAYLFAVADGLGGHSGGEIASKCVVDKSIEEFKKTPKLDSLAQCFQKAQEELMDLQVKHSKENAMKTTLVLLSICGETAKWGHIGDSRLYVFKDGKIETRTRDHSVPQMLVATGEIEEKEIRHHPDRNRLLRVMGVEWDSPRYDLSEKIEIESKMAFLLCSDGFWELIEERDMCKLLGETNSPQKWLEEMEKIVLKNGLGEQSRLNIFKKKKSNKMDNYTALAVWSK